MKDSKRTYSTPGLTQKQIAVLDNWAEANPILPRVDRNGVLYFLMPMVYTWAIVCKVDQWSYHHRFCYRSLREAISAYDDWDVSMKTEPKNYVKRKGIESVVIGFGRKGIIASEKTDE